jgi:mono/diheme cytochrome c family protein
MKQFSTIICLATIFAACHQPAPPGDVDSHADLIARGKQIFFNETFDGNGRTCGTCHREENNFTIDPAFIATLPDDDPLFVAEFNPNLKEHFENPRLMRQFGLILENADGYDDLANKYVQRSVPHLLGLQLSVKSNLGPFTGWSGDGAPGDGSLRSFATGAVIQHYTKTLNRVPGVDYRLPTDAELDALEAYQLSLGRQAELILPLRLKDKSADRGQQIFNDLFSGKCFICHFNAGPKGNPEFFGDDPGNLNFDTGINVLSGLIREHTGERMPPDDGFGAPGDGTFNAPSLVEAADTAPFFHNNQIESLEDAVAFYSSEIFNSSPAGQLIKEETGSGIHLDKTQVRDVAAFLRIINALENIRQSMDLLENYTGRQFQTADDGSAMLRRVIGECKDAAGVLKGGGLHPDAVILLSKAWITTEKALNSYFFRGRYARTTIDLLAIASNDIIEEPDS